MSARVLRGPKLQSSIPHRSLGHFLHDCCVRFPERICQVDGCTNQKETYADVKLRSTRLALSLQERGLTSNDVVLVCSGNTIDNSIPVIAALFLGAKVSNLDSTLSARHINHLVNLVTPKYIFVEEEALKKIEDSLYGSDVKPEIIVMGESVKYAVFNELLQIHREEETFSPSEVDADDVSVIFFSSGTTGLPKAICHSHRSFLRVIDNGYQNGWRGVTFHFSTFYCTTAMMIFCTSFKNGGCRTFCRDASAEDVFRIIQQHKVEFIFLAPILTYQLTNFENASRYDTSSLKLIATGGTPLAESQTKRMNEVFKTAPTFLLYGMTEVGLITSFNQDDDPTRRMSSSGKLLANMLLKVVDQNNDTLLGPNQKGEIRIFSPSLMKGYYKADSSSVFDEDGFLKTGDIGYFDEDGYIYVIERIKEMFKYKSRHVVPSAIEAVLLEHPNIKEAVVFGVPREEEGEVPAAVVVPTSDGALDEAAVHAFLEDKVADRERLRGGVRFLKSLPVTPSGKINRTFIKNLVINSLMESREQIET